MTEIGYEYQGDFECSSPLENGRKTRLLNIINYLSDVTEWRSIQIFNYLENADLVDQVLDELKMKCGKFDIDELRSVITFALHFAIMFSKTKMVGHLLKPPHSADPTRSGIDGMDALRIAGTFAKDPEIFDVLLAHDNIKIDRVDREGETALHAAASTSNVVAVKHLINKGAHPNIVDKNGTSPLRLAAQKRDGNPIIDLLLEAQKVKGMGDVNDQDKRGWTTLHHAALASNEITAEHLIQKGADLNRRADDEYTPLHVAAIFAKNMNIIDVLLKNVKNEDINTNYAATILASAKRNMHGLGDQIVARLKAKGIVGIDESKITETDVEMIRLLIEIERYIGTKTLGENGMNLLHSASFHAKTTDVIDIILETGEFDINGGDNDGLTPLHYALLGLYPKRNVAHLIQLGADPNVADKNGVTALNMAARNAESMHLIELLLLNREPVGVGYCDKQEYYFYPTSNVCRVNS
jgi:ankyrin repeat protein